MDYIFIEGIELAGRHGHFEEERARGNVFLIDIRLAVDAALAASTDNLEDAADYTLAAKIAEEAVDGPSVRLIETLAERIASAILERMPHVREAGIKLAKLNPPMDPPAVAAVVRICRGRNGARQYPLSVNDWSE